MAKRQIMAIGVEIPGGEIETIPFNQHKSLADADIILFAPNLNLDMYSNKQLGGYNKGLPSLTEHASFKLKEDNNFWKIELEEALKAGKTIFFILNRPTEYYIYSGNNKTSGTGKNQKVTNLVDKYNSYSVLPLLCGGFHTTNGKKVDFSQAISSIKQYWNNFNEYSNYQVIIKGFKGVQSIKQHSTNHTVGGTCKFKNGHCVFLPYLKLDMGKFIEYVENEVGEKTPYWNESASNFNKKFISDIIRIDKEIRSEFEIEIPPDWTNQEQFRLEKILELIKGKAKLEIQLKIINSSIEEYNIQLQETNIPKLLLFGTGKPLEKAIRIVLRQIGFTAEHFEDEDSEFDVKFESHEGQFLGEAEGKESKAVDITKLSQLMRNITEDLTKDDVKEPAKGVLFGNGFRFIEPTKRKEQFTDKCIKSAKAQRIALIKTTDLFTLHQFFAKKENTNFAKQCRAEILKTAGIVKFPAIPDK